MSAVDEHLATRRGAGLFDFSFMALHEFHGQGPAQTRDLDALAPGQIAYTLLLKDDGAVLIDATVWRLDAERYWLFAGRRGDYGGRDRSGELAILALQGPASGRILARLIGADAVRALRYFRFLEKDDLVIARIGFSGELGYELLVPAADAPALRQRLLDARPQRRPARMQLGRRRQPAHRVGLRALRPRGRRPRQSARARPGAPRAAPDLPRHAQPGRPGDPRRRSRVSIFRSRKSRANAFRRRWARAWRSDSSAPGSGWAAWCGSPTAARPASRPCPSTTRSAAARAPRRSSYHSTHGRPRLPVRRVRHRGRLALERQPRPRRLGQAEGHQRHRLARVRGRMAQALPAVDGRSALGPA